VADTDRIGRASAFIVTASSAAGIAGCTLEGTTISCSMMRRTVSSSFSPRKRRLSVRHSCSTTPAAKMSVRESTSAPRACSGAM